MIKIANLEFQEGGLITKALTHSSYSANNYERLEFLGDSILDFLVADILFSKRDYKEDELTRCRANIVSEESLSVVFDNLNILPYVKVGKQCKTVTRAMKCDMLESVVAAVYLTFGMDACKQFVLENLNFLKDDSKDYKTKFQEYAQKQKLDFNYKLVKTEGPAHNLVFFVELYVNGELASKASSFSRADAEKLCAKIALEKLIK